MKTAILGGKGFIGSNLFPRLKGNIFLYEHGQPFTSLIRFEPDIIYHLAAEIYNESEMFESNIKLTYDLLEACKQLPKLKALIYVGSSSEYGRKDHPMLETDYLDPTNLYEATKGAGSLLCQAYAREYGIPCMVARPFSVYGKNEPAHRFIPTVIRNIKAGWEIKLAPGVHDFIHVEDFLNGIQDLAAHPKPGECFNFGTGVQTSNEEVVRIVESIVKRKAKITPIEKLHTYDSDCWVSAKPKSKWKHKIGIKEGLKRAVDERTWVQDEANKLDLRNSVHQDGKRK